MIRCVRMWTGEDGDSLFEEGLIELPAACVATRLASLSQWSNCPFRRQAYSWLITM